MFCGECGRSVATTRHTIAPAVAASFRSDPTVLPEVAVPSVVASAPAPAPAPAPRIEPVVRAEPEADRASEATVGLDAFGPRASSSPASSPIYLPRQPAPAQPAPAPAAPAPFAVEHPDLIDVENTRLTRPAQAGERFVLQFSTGESVTVFGTGLVGRNPASEPGEFFDHRVMIFDPSRSVSKTHLEFGQTAGEFWINDRFSGNGTGVRAPDSPRQHCDPGKRYMVARGSRVDIGEQFFIVS